MIFFLPWQKYITFLIKIILYVIKLYILAVKKSSENFKFTI